MIETLYELVIYRDGDKVGTVLFVAEPPTGGTLPPFVATWCKQFIDNVSHDRAHLSIVTPGRVSRDGMETMTKATLVREWPPQW